MSEMVGAATFRDKLFLGLEPKEYLHTLATPGNALAAAILTVGIPVTIVRFWQGLGAVTNLSQTTPWGLWVAFDILAGVALAAGGFTLAFTVAILGAKTYGPVLRPAILTGFLGYALVLVGLVYDLGQPWRLPYQFFLTPGTTAVMYEVGWCVFLYLMVLAFEFLPAPLEWLGLKKARLTVARATMGAIVLGVVLSTLHQSSLGAFFLMAPGKVHPLWYSPYLPLFFFVSAITAGIGMVILESALTHRLLADPLNLTGVAAGEKDEPPDLGRITAGLSRGGAIVLFSLFFARLQGLADGGHWNLLLTGWGAWWMVEVVGLILLPSILFAFAARGRGMLLARIAATLTVLGVLVNRFNVSLIAMNWDKTPRYLPSVSEVIVSLTVVTLGVLAFRFAVNRMPVVREDPAYAGLH